MNNKISLKFKKLDLIVYLTIALLIISMSITIIVNKLRTKGNTITVSYYGEVVHTMKLDVDEQYVMRKEEFPRLLGDITIIVENNKVRVDKQTSQHNYCELMGDQDTAGTSLICAPNGVVVSILGNSASSEDFILR